MKSGGAVEVCSCCGASGHHGALVLAQSDDVPAKKPRGPLAWFFVKMVRFYQVNISPLKPPVCRFTPSCSEYMRQAIIKHGALRGTYLGTRRLLRCHPFTPPGHDPVP